MKFNVFVKISRKYELLGWDGEELTVGINAPPIDNAANTKLIQIISAWLGVSKSKVVIIKGHTSRHKMLEVDINPKLFNSLVVELPKLFRQNTLF